jgi:hypothetical protein
MLLICLITGLPAFTQKQIKGQINDLYTGKPIMNASITIKDQSVWTTTDTTGFFSLSARQLPFEIVISHISYQEQKLIISTVKQLNLALIPKTYSIDEVVVDGSLYRRVCTDREFYIIDYQISGDYIYYLGYQGSINSGSLRIQNIYTRQDLEKLVNQPLSLKKDYVGNIHLITRDSVYQLFKDSCIHLLYPDENKPLYHELFAFIHPFGPFLIKKDVEKNNQAISFLAIDTADFSASIIYESFDPDLFQNFNQAKRFRMWMYRGDGKTSIDPSFANEMFRLYSFDKNVIFRPRDAWLEVKDDLITILDPNASLLVVLDKTLKIRYSKSLDFNRSSGNNYLQLIKDQKANQLYMVNMNWGHVDVYHIDPLALEWKLILSLDGYLNIQNPQVYGDTLYFLYLTKTYPSVVTLFSRKL